MPDVELTSGHFVAPINLNSLFKSTTITGTAIEIALSVGGQTRAFDLGLYDSATPTTVNNFLRYVHSGTYAGSFIDRAVADSLIQGGGYSLPGPFRVPSFGDISSEFSNSLKNAFGEVNVAGTIAMYRDNILGSSASSRFLINIGDNSSIFDSQDYAYTVFGRVLGNGLSVIEQVSSLPTTSDLSPFGHLPVTGYAPGSTPTSSNVVTIARASVVPAVNYEVSSSDTRLVAAEVSSQGVLSLALQPGQTGRASITLTATDLDGATNTAAFSVTVDAGANLSASVNGTRIDPSAATPTSFGRVAALPDDEVTREILVQNVGSSSLDHLTYSLSAASAAYKIVGSPPDVLEPGQTGAVMVRINPSATGEQSATLSVGDSETTDVFLSLPLDVTIDRLIQLNASARSLSFTQGSGADATAGKFTLTAPGGGNVAFVLSGSGLGIRTAGSNVMVDGNALIESFAFSDTSLATKLTLSAKKGSAISLGSISGSGNAQLGAFAAPQGVLNGSLEWGSNQPTGGQIRLLSVGRIEQASIFIGPSTAIAAAFSLSADKIIDSSISVGYLTKSITAGIWTGGSFGGTSLGSLAVRSDMGSSISLAGSLGAAKVSGSIVGGEWRVAGGLKSLIAGSGAGTFQLDSYGPVGTVTVARDFSGEIDAASLGRLEAASGTGTTVNVSNAASSSATTGTIKSIAFKGNVVSGRFNASKSIGAFSANSIAATRIYAGTTILPSDVFPTTSAQFVSGSWIGSVTLKGKGADAAFSRSVLVAQTLGTLKLGTISGVSGTESGIAASLIQLFQGVLPGPPPKKLAGKQINSQAKAALLLGTLATTPRFSISVIGS